MTRSIAFPYSSSANGFTLIELSIVLVVIGLITGGILTSTDLINAAAVRAQIAQIEKYNTAVRTFEVKYGDLAGDIPNPKASRFGFAARGTNPGEGDGNGMIQAWNGLLSNTGQEGESMLFWNDLSTSGLIENKFAGGAFDNVYKDIWSTVYPIRNYLPQAKIGQENYIYVWSLSSTHYFGLSAYNASGNGIASDGTNTTATSALSVQQAYDIDAKIDDGLPQTGSVQAVLGGFWWAGSFSSWYAGSGIGGQNTAAWSGSSTSCFDNNGVNGTTQKYSLKQNGGQNINCALSFRFL